MATLEASIDAIILQDPGNRNFFPLDWTNPLKELCLSLVAAQKISLSTGFYMLKNKTIETDGPPGLIALALALEKMGKTVNIYIENYACKLLESLVDLNNLHSQVFPLSPGKVYDAEELVSSNLSHFISIERPGLNANNDYSNVRGQSVKAQHAVLDALFHKAAAADIQTVGIGDGGNELGMGIFSSTNSKYCVTPATWVLCAGVSNWACYGLATMLSGLCQKRLLFSVEDFMKSLDVLLSFGVVDGITGRVEASVDGLGLDWELKVLTELHTLLDSVL